MNTLTVALSAFVIQGADALPAVGIFVLPVAPLAAEVMEIPSSPKKPAKPGAPRSSAAEKEWSSYRERLSRYQAAWADYETLRNQRTRLRTAQASARAARDKSAKELTELGYSTEYNLRQINVFKVLSDYQTKFPTSGQCHSTDCLAQVVAKAALSAVIVLRAVAGAEKAELTWTSFTSGEIDGRAIAHARMALGSSARTGLPEFSAPALRSELRKALALASRSERALDWQTMKGAAQRILLIDSKTVVGHYYYGRSLFELGELSAAERELSTAEQQLSAGRRQGRVARLRALIYLRWRRVDLAHAAFQRALVLGVGGFEARLFVARALLRPTPVSAENESLALSHLRHALSQRPRHGEANFLSAMVHLRHKKSKKAITGLQLAAEADHRAAEAHLHLGMIAGADNQLEKASQHLQLAHAGGRTSAASLLLMGHILRHTDKPAALRLLQRAQALGIRGSDHGLNFDIDIAIAELGTAVKDLSIAVAAYRRATSRPEQALLAHRRLELIFVQQKNVPLAAHHRRALLKLGDDTSAGRGVLARAAALRGRVAEQEQHLRAGLRLQPHHPQLNLALARLLFAERGAVAARPYYLKAPAKQRGRAGQGEVPRALGLADLEAGQLQRAVKNLRHARTDGAQDERLLRSLARALERIPGTSASARSTAWSQLLHRVQGDAEASLKLGLLHFAAAEYDQAGPHLVQATGSRSFRAAAHRALGDIDFGRDATQEALAHYLSSARHQAAGVDLLLAIARAAELVGDLETARHHIVRALAFHPNDTKLCLKAAQLYDLTGRAAQAQLLLRRARQ